MEVLNHLQSHAFIINELRATNSSICPGLINKVDSIYISFPWLIQIYVNFLMLLLYQAKSHTMDVLILNRYY